MLLREKIFDRIWIQPAAGDAGGALGAALLTAHQYFDIPRRRPTNGRDSQCGSYLGPRYQPQEVRAYLDRNDYVYEHVPDEDERAGRIADAMADG